MKNKRRKRTGIFWAEVLFVLIFSLGIFVLDDLYATREMANDIVGAEAAAKTEDEDRLKEKGPEKPPEPVVRTARIAVTGDLMVHSYQYIGSENKR